jgi:hypothetical protein
MFSVGLAAAMALAGCLSDTNNNSGTAADNQAAGSTGAGTTTGGGGDTATTTTTAGAGGAASGVGGGASVVGAGGALPEGGVVVSSDAAVPAGDAKGKIVAGMRWVGRVDATDPTKPKFGWGGSGFVAMVNVTGTTLSVKVNNDNVIYFQPIVDGTLGTRIRAPQGAGTLQINTGPAGNHTVEVYRDTESAQGITTFLGISGGTLGTPPTYSGRLIETIGDSASNGYGVLGSESHPNNCSTTINACPYSIDTQADYQVYTVDLARELNADWSVVANSGWGLYRDSDNGMQNLMGNVYDDAYYSAGSPPKWDYSVPAQAVIINLGGNDTAHGDPGIGFKDALKKLATNVRAKYPGAWIFPLSGPMTDDKTRMLLGNYIKMAVTELADPKVFYVDIGTQDACNMPTGCGWHPSIAEHKRIANLLAPVFKSKLGW